MDLHKFCVKFFAEDPSAVEISTFIPVFHRWIQKQAVEGLLVDVADYGHVPQGPGVVLVAHEADYSMDSMEGPLGLLYSQKASIGGRLSDRIANAFRAALGACVKLENEPEFQGKVRFQAASPIFIANDRLHAPNTEETFQALDRDRLPVLLGLFALFAAVILAFGGMQGVRSILSLAGSFFVILYILLPGILKGAPPVLMSVVVAGFVLVLALYSTHGWRRTTHAAFLGTIATVSLTGILATLAVRVAELTGFSSDEAVYLNTQLGGMLDARGLLLGGIIIGILGILDDIAITQSSVVAELKSAANRLSNAEIYARALRVGKEHVGALVNTLALAYTGSALPLLLLFVSDKTPALVALNGELVATEIVRTIVGSLGLVMAVPITTALAVIMVKPGDEGHEHVHGQPQKHSHYSG